MPNLFRDRENKKTKMNIEDANSTDELLQKYLKNSMKDIENKIASMISKYGKDNNLTYEQAIKNLTSSEYKELRMDLSEYLEKIKATGNDRLLLELNTLSMKSRISREEELFYNITKIMNDNYIFQLNEVKELLEKGVIKNYLETNKNVCDTLGIDSTFGYIDKEELETIINAPWSGRSYKDNILNVRDKSLSEVRKAVTKAFITGADLNSISRELAHITKISNYSASRIVHTEHAYACTQGDLKMYDNIGVDSVEFLATLDMKTSQICREHDKKIINLKKAVVGIDLPPLHPY